MSDKIPRPQRVRQPVFAVDEEIPDTMRTWMRHIALVDPWLEQEDLVFALIYTYRGLKRIKYLLKAFELVLTTSERNWQRMTDPRHGFPPPDECLKPIARVWLRELPFQHVAPFDVYHPTLISAILLAAQDIVEICDCTIETGIMASLGQLERPAKMPDPLTLKALSWILAKFGIPYSVIEIEQRFPDLPWHDIRKALRKVVESEVSRKRGTPEGGKPYYSEYPKFCQTAKECEKRITAAGISVSRGFLNVRPRQPGTGGTVEWFDRPD